MLLHSLRFRLNALAYITTKASEVEGVTLPGLELEVEVVDIPQEDVVFHNKSTLLAGTSPSQMITVVLCVRLWEDWSLCSEVLQSL